MTRGRLRRLPRAHKPPNGINCACKHCVPADPDGSRAARRAAGQRGKKLPDPTTPRTTPMLTSSSPPLCAAGREITGGNRHPDFTAPCPEPGIITLVLGIEPEHRDPGSDTDQLILGICRHHTTLLESAGVTLPEHLLHTTDG